MINKLTIVLSLKDRSNFTYRWMKYMNAISCPYKILIADGGGVDKVLEEHLTNTRNYPNLNYEYFRYTFDKNLDIYYKKVTDVINKVNTEYFIHADNDDFYILDHFKLFIDYLDENKDFVSCGGSPVFLNLLTNKKRIINSEFGENYVAYYHNHSQSIVHDDPVERVKYFFENTENKFLWWLYYNIHRTSVVKKIYRIHDDYQFKEITIFELHTFIQLLLEGKVKEFKCPYYLRQNGTSLSHEINLEENLIKRYILNNSFLEIQKILNNVKRNLNEESAIEINRSIADWFINSTISLYSPTKTNKVKKFFKNIFIEKSNFSIYYIFLTLKEKFSFFNKNRKTYVRFPVIEKHIRSN